MRVCIIAGLVLILTGGVSQAGLLAGDTNGMAGWQGTERFQSAPDPFLTVDVDYCVYDSIAAFQSTFGFDPTGGSGVTTYVYTYQVFDDLPDHPYFPEENRDYVTSLSVGLNGGDEQEANIGYISNVGEINPLLAYFAPFTAAWKFIPAVDYGEKSSVLYFTSPFGPALDTATVLGYEAKTEMLPSPMPEPTTLVLFGVSIAMTWSVRWRRKA